jgi:hypothetical protein
MLMRDLLAFGAACALIELLPAGASAAEADSVTSAAVKCQALENANFSGIPDAPAQVTAAKLEAVKEYLPAHCQVNGYVTPQVGFELELPVTNWNKKFIEIGCGGHCGVIEFDGHNSCEGPLRKGYACIVSDMGHKGTAADGLWGLDNLQAKVDWGFRATHVAALAGKAIAEHYYQDVPKKSYYMGCSTGGRQGLQEAQRFPWDFDGIIAGAPPVDMSTLYMTDAWSILVTHDTDGKPLLGEADLKLVTDAAIAKCDLDDGVKDGIISDPRHCRFDPSELTCRANQTSGCLSPSQVDAVKKVYAGPVTSGGVKLSPGGPMPGSEFGHENDDLDWGVAFVGVSGKPATTEPLVTEGLRDLMFLPELGSAWRLSDFDFDRDYKRLGVMESLYDASNPDLRKFKATGGKLLAYQGTNDISVLPQITEDYYEAVERTMGGREATQSFFRLFVLPGVEHCWGGDGADTLDFLSALEAWVEKGEAPNRLIAAHLKKPTKKETMLDMPGFPLDPGNIQFTRPVYPYPTKARYQGRGDPNDAASFGPSTR